MAGRRKSGGDRKKSTGTKDTGPDTAQSADDPQTDVTADSAVESSAEKIADDAAPVETPNADNAADETVQDAEVVAEETEEQSAETMDASSEDTLSQASEDLIEATEPEGSDTDQQSTSPDGEPLTDAEASETAEIEEAATEETATEESAHEDEHYDEHDEEIAADGESRSLASRVLTWAAIFFIGIIAALWGGPKIAPYLPSGLAPVAAWLTPGSTAVQDEVATVRTDIEALEKTLNAKIDALELGVPQSEMAAAIQSGLSEAQTKADATTKALSENIASLGDQIKATDSSEIESRLAKVETALSGLETTLKSLSDDLSGVIKGDGENEERTAAQSAQISAEIAAFSAAVKGLKGELQDLAGKTGALSQRVDEVATASARREADANAEAEAAKLREEETLRRAAYSNAIKDLTRQVESGSPFPGILDQLAEISGKPVPDALKAAAATGVPTLVSLRNDLPDAAHAAIRASISEESGEGLLGRASAFLESQVASRSLQEREGSDTDAILSRIEARISEDNLEAVMTEADALSASARSHLEGWLLRVKLRHDSLSEFRALISSVPPVEG